MNYKMALSFLVAVCVAYALAQNGTTHEGPTDTSAVNTDVTITTAGHTSVEPRPTGELSTEHPNTSVQTTTAHTTEVPTTQKPSGVWSVQHNGTYCILLSAVISIKFRYNSTKTNQFVTNTTNVPLGATVNGSCEAVDQWIQLSFFDNWRLKMVFHRTNDSKYYLSSVDLEWVLGSTTFPDAPKDNGSNENSQPMFNTSKDGYLCTARMTMYENGTVNQGLYGIYTEKLKLEAFQKKTEPKFSDKYERCSEDTISNLVPIIVGACLGGLIIIVLIAYLIGRKRSRRGYESV